MASAYKAGRLAAVVTDEDIAADPRPALQKVRELRQAAEARGENVADEIMKLERQLFQECIAESQGR